MTKRSLFQVAVRMAMAAGACLAVGAGPLLAQTAPMPAPKPGPAELGQPQPPTQPAFGPPQELPKPNSGDPQMPGSGPNGATQTGPNCTIVGTRDYGGSNSNTYITSRPCLKDGSKKRPGG